MGPIIRNLSLSALSCVICLLVAQHSYGANVSATVLASNGGRVDWSAQNLIAFDRLSPNGYYDIWTMNPEGLNQVCLTCSKPGAPTKNKGNPAWHPSGRYIVFEGQYSNNFLPNTLTNPGAGVANDLWIMDATGTNYWKIVDTFNGGQASGVLHPHFSHDGTKLFWAQLVQADGALGDWQLHIADFNVQNGVPVLSNITTLYQPLGARAFYESHGFTMDDKQVIFTASAVGSKFANEYRMDPVTNQYVNLTDDNNAWNEHGQINPSYNTIAWVSSRGMADNQTLNLWLMNADGSNQEEVVDFHNATLPYFSPGVGPADSSWSPDGTKLAVYTETPPIIYLVSNLPTPPPTTSTLAVSTTGTGFGMIFGPNNTINCGINPDATLCNTKVTNGTTVTLTAVAASGSVFGGWSGACSGTGSCVLAVNANMNVTANFSAQAEASGGVQTINATYTGLNDSFSACSVRMGIWGQKPSGPGPFPVHIHVVGTGEDYQSGEAQTIVSQMVSRGFLAVSIQYPNSFQNPGTSHPYSCSLLKSKMACMFNAGSPSSALAAICALPGANCNLGITMSGISQGAQIATMAKDFDPRVQAVYGMADGDVLEVNSDISINMKACMDPANRSLPADRLRAINGDADQFFGQTSSGVGTELNGITGQTCDPNNASCLRSDGSGWYKVQDSEVQNPPAGHVYITDPGWQPPKTYAWSVVPNLDWLAGFITNTHPPLIASFTATPTGNATTLTWRTIGATAVSINPGNITSSMSSGSTTVSPAQTTTYVLTATDSSGVTTGISMVTVLAKKTVI